MIDYTDLYQKEFTGEIDFGDKKEIIKLRFDNCLDELETYNLINKLDFTAISNELKTISYTDNNKILLDKIVFLCVHKDFEGIKIKSLVINGKEYKDKYIQLLIFEAIYELFYLKHYNILSNISLYFKRSDRVDLNQYKNLPNPVQQEQPEINFDDFIFNLIEAMGNLPVYFHDKISLIGILIFNRYLERKNIHEKMELINLLRTNSVDTLLLQNGKESMHTRDLIEQYREILGYKRRIFKTGSILDFLNENINANTKN